MTTILPKSPLNRNDFLVFLVVLLWVIGGSNGCGDNSQTSTNDLNALLGDSGDSSLYRQVDGSYRLEFPKDHGAHRDYLIEWWYITSVLRADNGIEFGAQFTVFRRAISKPVDSSNPWRSSQIYMAHIALSDIENKKHFDEERLSREHEQLAGAKTEPFQVFVEDWVLSSTDQDFFPLRLQASADEFSLDLRFDQTKPIVLQGKDGYSVKSPEHASYYYSVPRLKTSGQVLVGGQWHSVTGNSWLDREWSSGLLGRQFQGWYWFALSLDDGRDLVLFSLWDKEKESDDNRVATWIDQRGTSESLDRTHWQLEPRRYWKSWPVEWNLRIQDSDLKIKAKFDNQEMNTSIPYWEGVVDVIEGTRSIGSGYMELTGFSNKR